VGPGPAPRPLRRSTLLALGGLVVVGTILRLYGLGRGLWTDEVSTLVHYVRPSLIDILTTYDSQNQHTLYSLLAHLSITIFGESAWALRLPAALFGIATIPALVWLGRAVTDDREALLAGLVLTVSYQHIWFSQNARGYSGVLFFAVVASACFVHGLRSGRREWWWTFAGVVALGMYVHLTMAFVVGVMGAYYGWTLIRRQSAAAPRFRPFLHGFLPAGAGTLLLYGPVLSQMAGATQGDVSDVATWRSLTWMLRETVAGLGLSPVVIGPALVGVAIAGAGVWSYARKQPVIAWLLVGSVGAGAVAMIALHHHLWPRFFFYGVGFGILVVVRGLTVTGEGMRRVVRASPAVGAHLGTLLTVGAVVVLSRSLPYVYRPKQDFAAARDFVRQALAPGDAVVTTGVAASPYRLYYMPAWTSVTTADDLRAVQARARRVWILYTLPTQLRDNHPDLLDLIHSEFQEIRVFDGSLHGGAVYVCLSPPDPASRPGPGATWNGR